jgi:uncharacterized protein YdcH (DUF465 family)
MSDRIGNVPGVGLFLYPTDTENFPKTSNVQGGKMSVRLFKSLLYKSTQIQQEIEQEHERRKPDRFRLLKLKKIRLSIKDRLQRLWERHRATLENSPLAFQPVPVRIKHR